MLRTKTRRLPAAMMRLALPKTAPPTVPIPLQVSGLRLWLQADAITGLVDGSPVSLWPDSSGLGNHATQSNTAHRPAYRTGVLGGHPVVRFDGATGYLTIPNAATLNPTTLSLFVVGALSNSNRIQGFVGKVTDIWSDVSYGLRGLPGNSYGFFVGPGPDELSTAGANTAAHILVATSDGSTRSIRRNGTLLASKPWTNPLPTSASPLYVGAYAGGSGLSYLLDGDIAEVLLYDALFDANRQIIERYLGGKYGITVP